MTSASKYPSKDNDQIKAEQDRRIADAAAVTAANEAVRAQELREYLARQRGN